jgi:hypothetical protein
VCARISIATCSARLVQTVIVCIGLNDLAGADAFYPAFERASADDVIAGLRQLIGRAHEYSLTILGCTISLMGGNTSLPSLRYARARSGTPGAQSMDSHSWVFDGVVDADRVLRDPSQPLRLLPAYDSGDHVHPNPAGGGAVATRSASSSCSDGRSAEPTTPHPARRRYSASSASAVGRRTCRIYLFAGGCRTPRAQLIPLDQHARGRRHPGPTIAATSNTAPLAASA